MHASLVDALAALFILVHVIVSWRRGLSEEIGRLVGAIAALTLGVLYHDDIAAWMTAHTRLSGNTALVVGFVGTVLLIMLVSLVVNLFTRKMIKLAIAEDTDHILGALAGLLKSSIYVTILFLILIMVPHDYLNHHFGEQSVIGRTVAPLVPSVAAKLDEWAVGERVQEELERGREEARELIKEGSRALRPGQ